MVMKAVLDNLDELDESLKEHYKQDAKSGKFVLDIDNHDALPVVRTLKDESAKNRIKARDAENKLKAFEPLGDIAKVQEQLDRIPELEALAEGKVDETKIEGLVNSRLKAKTAPLERERDQLKQQLTAKEQEVEAFRTKDRTRTIREEVQREGRALKILDTALEDAVMLAERQLEVGEDGKIVTKESSGNAGLDVKAWLTDLQPKRPHWWPASAGGGGRSGGSGGLGGENPWKADQWNLTKQGQIVREDPAKADRLAKAAGSKVGALKPAEKK